MSEYETHVVAIPFPGRGHVNPMMNLCKSLSSTHPNLLITVVLTPEWLHLLSSDPHPPNTRFASLPADVIPPERLKATDFPSFYEAVMTQMEAPTDLLLRRLRPPATTVIADVELLWGVRLANRRNIPVAAFWTMSASVLSMFHRFNLCNQISPELAIVFRRNDRRVVGMCADCVSWVPKAQVLVLTNVYELEPKAVDELREKLRFPVYTIGPAVPYPELNAVRDPEPDYLTWLDAQPPESVLYISLGSFLSVSGAQMDEIAAGLTISGVRFLWVARAEAARLSHATEMGLVVSWCQQLKVLSHGSVGGFWTHCGWNSTLEGVFAGVPMLTMPLFLDQESNGGKIVEEWKIGRRVSEVEAGGRLVTRDEISSLVVRFMGVEGEEMRKRAKDLGSVCGQAIATGGSSKLNLDAFVTDTLLSRKTVVETKETRLKVQADE